MTKYIKVDWPDSQKFADYPECFLAISNNPIDYEPSGNTYMVPEDLYDEIMNPPFKLPEKYTETFTTEFERIKRGQKVLIEDIETGEIFIVESYTNYIGDSLPCILSNNYLPGINCYILAVEKNIQKKN